MKKESHMADKNILDDSDDYEGSDFQSFDSDEDKILEVSEEEENRDSYLERQPIKRREF